MRQGLRPSLAMSSAVAAITPSKNKARQVALQALFEADVTGHAAEPALERLLLDVRVSTAAAATARKLVSGVTAAMAEVDRLIEGAAPLWPLEQVAAIDRNVLRLAAYELVLKGVDAPPEAMVINEAVELAKRYGSESSARFVNGVLGTLLRSMAPAGKSVTSL